MTYFNPDQVDHLLRPIAPTRVLALKSMSYVAQHDVRAHMNRVFGFGRWSTDVVETEFMFEEQDGNNRWKACYRATVKVTVFAPDGTEVAHYTDSHASGCMPQPDRADAHALSLTTAVSTAFKRACTNLGDQFGLSLYNKGQKAAFVKTTLIGSAEATVADDVVVTGLGDEGGDADEAPVQPLNEARATRSISDREAVDAGKTKEQIAIEENTDAALGELRVFSSLTAAGERILQVSKWKQEHAAILDATTEVGGQQMTLGLLADRVAAGQFSKAE